MRFELAPGLHLYDEPVPDGMVATRIVATGPPGLRMNELVKMPTQPLRLPGIGHEFRVWEGRAGYRRVRPFTLTVPVAPYVGHELPGKMPGAIATTMDSRKYMMRMVRRGLLRSPFKGFQYLKSAMKQVADGPLGRRARKASRTA